jgi:hypothetical protein
MKEQFLQEMEQFAFSIDIVDEEIWRDIRKLIEGYLIKLKISNFRLLVERPSKEGPSLVSEWKMGDNDNNWGHRIMDDKRNYVGQVAFAYDKKKCLWVVGANKEALLETSRYNDCWNLTNHRDKEIPGSKANKDIYTSIFIPLKFEFETSGIVCFESTDYLECTPAQKEVFETLARVIQLLYQLYATHRLRKSKTDLVLSGIEVPEEVIIPKPKDQVFLAYPERADQDVIKAIKDLLSDKYEDKLDVIDWRENPEPGSISRRLVKDILKCEYGICYLSEKPDDSPEVQFKDNPNVLIEAGMFYILSQKKTRKNLKNWILIREKENLHSDKLPFDLKDFNIFFVNRETGSDGASEMLNQKKFKDEFESWIDCLLRND